MIKKFRLCVTAVLVFGFMGWFIQFLEAESTNRYQSSLFGGMSASFSLHNSAIKPSTIRFIPKNTQKISIISNQKKTTIKRILDNEKNTLTRNLHTNVDTYQTVLYLKSQHEAQNSHQILEIIRSEMDDQDIILGDFGNFADKAQSISYFNTTAIPQTFVDYKTIIEDSNMILWIGKP